MLPNEAMPNGPLLSESTMQQVIDYINDNFDEFVFSGVKSGCAHQEQEIWYGGIDSRVDGLVRGVVKYFEDEYSGEYYDITEENEDGEEDY